VLADVVKMPALALVGRFLEGLWTGGQQSVEQAYLAFVALPGERTALTSKLGTFAVLGFILGPAFGAIFTGLDVTILGFKLDAYVHRA
jgi:MFS family permease